MELRFIPDMIPDHDTPETSAPAGSGFAQVLQRCLARQRSTFEADPWPDYPQRIADLGALKRLVVENQEAIVSAISADYGTRFRQETLFAEIIMVLDGINFARRHLRLWMRPQRRHVDVTLYPGGKSRLIPQPLGVVGVIVPWNFPLQLSFAPLTCIFAAGNRAMVKMSKNSSALAALLIRITPAYFPPEKLSFFAESGEVGIAFSQLRFDHLLFTGSGTTGRAVMASAARNLTPVTLELGGKSPAVIAPDFPLQKAVERILFAKLFNSGQVCITVDHVFVPSDRVDAFVQASKDYASSHLPDINGEDYTAIIDERAFERLASAIADAEAKGGTLVNLAPGQAADPGKRKIAPQLLLRPRADMSLMQREIFGPILPVIPYQDATEVVDHILRGDRPLAFYPFTNDAGLQEYYLQRVQSGGVCVNDVFLQYAQHDLPFGGVGASGMGHYHGREGFNTFSKLRPVFYQARFSVLKWLAPLHGSFAKRVLKLLLKTRI